MMFYITIQSLHFSVDKSKQTYKQQLFLFYAFYLCIYPIA